jgi:hypothetical protein
MDKIKEFLTYVTAQKEAGLIIANQTASLVGVENFLTQSGFKEKKDPISALETLASGTSVFAVLRSPLSKDFCDLITQYQERGYTIQLTDKTKMDYKTFYIDPTVAHLILITLDENLSEISKSFPILEKVGLVERI